MQKPKYKTRLNMLHGLSKKDKFELHDVCEKFPFRANDYYLSLIDKISRSHRVGVAEVSQQNWSEVDFPGDFVEARNCVRRWKAEAITSTTRPSIEPSSLPSIAAER